MDSVSQNPPGRNRKAVEQESKAGGDAEEEKGEGEVGEERPVGAKSVEKVATWTR